MKLRSPKSWNLKSFFHIYLLKSRKYNPAKQPSPQGAFPCPGFGGQKEKRPRDEVAREILSRQTREFIIKYH